MTVLVADVLASYGLLLGRNFCRDVGGELNMDMIEARIRIKRVVQRLLPEKESKYTVVKSDDKRAQILFKSSGMGNYFMHANDGLKMTLESEVDTSLNYFPVDCKSSCESSVIESKEASTLQQEILNFDTISIGSPDDVWTLEFDGSCSSTGSRVGIVLVSPKGNLFPFSFKLQFNNTNNTAEYESLLLGMNVSQQKGIKNLHAQGDAELIVYHIINIYQARSERLRHYRNLV